MSTCPDGRSVTVLSMDFPFDLDVEFVWGKVDGFIGVFS